jgi:hypothetical protein
MNHFARMWREALPKDRVVACFLAGWTGVIFIVGSAKLACLKACRPAEILYFHMGGKKFKDATTG